MLEFLVDNIFVVFAGKVFQQIVGIPMGTNCAPLLADIFLYSYEAEFIQSLLSTGRKQLASRFNFTYRYIDDVLSINNPEFENYLGQMYPVELEIKDTTESNTSASYLDLLLSIGRDGQLHTSIYDKRDDFNFHITNFPFLSSNIPTSPAYGVFISQLIRYARACSSYGCFILRATRLSNKLLEQGYVKERLKSSLRKFYGRYGDLIKQYEVSLSQMLNDILWPDHIQWQPPTDQTLYRTRPFTEFWVVSICKCSFVETTDTQSYIRQPIHDSCPDLTSYRIWLLSLIWHHQFMTLSQSWPLTEFDITHIGFHGASATGVACRQGTLTPPDTWSRPFGTCICSTCWDQSFSELVVILPDYALRISLGTFSILPYIYTLLYLAQHLAASNVCHIFSKTETISIGKSWKLYTIYLVVCIYTDY